MDDWRYYEICFTKLNRRMLNENRNILLFIDNAGCHPDDLLSMFSNIKICFHPPNTTSALQPLDLGIIQNFKLHYRRFFLKYVISKMDECDTASDVVKSVNLLVAIRWIALAWSEVTSDTIVKCFRKAGILDKELDVVCRNNDDPFLEVDERMELDRLIEKTGDGGCMLDEFLTGDSSLPVCMETDDDNWQTTFFEELAGTHTSQSEEEDEEIEDENEDNDDEAPKIKSYKEAINTLEDVSRFLEYKGHGQETLRVGSFVDTLVTLKNQSAQQTALDSFLSQ